MISPSTYLFSLSRDEWTDEQLLGTGLGIWDARLASQTIMGWIFEKRHDHDWAPLELEAPGQYTLRVKRLVQNSPELKEFLRIEEDCCVFVQTPAELSQSKDIAEIWDNFEYDDEV